MTTFPNSPRLLKGGVVLIDADSGAVRRVIALQYNPDTLTRTLQVQGAGGEGGDRTEGLRLKGPPVETIKLEAEIDATDQLELGEQSRIAIESGIQPQLAALELMVYPSSAQLQANNAMAAAGVIEIISAQAPLAVFVWGRNRVLPVRVTEFSITEEAFDVSLNPIRAKVSLGMRVLSVNDVPFAHRAGGLFMGYQRQKEKLAARQPNGTFTVLGIEGVA